MNFNEFSKFKFLIKNEYYNEWNDVEREPKQIYINHIETETEQLENDIFIKNKSKNPLSNPFQFSIQISLVIFA